MKGDKLRQRTRQLNPKYSPAKITKIVMQVCEEYEKCLYTIKSCCENAGVPYTTFKGWMREFKKFGEEIPHEWKFFVPLEALYARVREINEVHYESELLHSSKSSLKKRIEGFEYEELVTEVKQKTDADGQTIMIPVGLKKTKKFIPPSETLIQFVLKNLEPEKWGDKVMNTNINLNTSKYERMSVEEIEEELRKLDKYVKTKTDNYYIAVKKINILQV